MLTVKQVAERLNVSQSFVYELLREGRLRHYSLGKSQGAKRISEAQLQAFLEEAEGQPPSASQEEETFRHFRAGSR